MSVLTRDEILKAIKNGEIVIEPFNPDQVGPGSVDLTLDNKFRVFKRVHYVFHAIESAYKEFIKKCTEMVIVKPGDYFLLMPHETVLGQTKEVIKTANNICGRLEGRSTFARMGLLVHISASFMQPGLPGNTQVLELSNVGNIPLALHPGEKICQFIFEKTIGEAPYAGKFRDQREP